MNDVFINALVERIKVDEMNRVEKIRVGESEFYLKFNADYSDYIL